MSATIEWSMVDTLREFSARGISAGFAVVTDRDLTRSSVSVSGQLAKFIAKNHPLPLGRREGLSSPDPIDSHLVSRVGRRQFEAFIEKNECGEVHIRVPELATMCFPGDMLAITVHEAALIVMNVGGGQDGGMGHEPLENLFAQFDSLKLRIEADPFLEWNLRILRTFFSGASKEEEVFLRINGSVLDQIGQDIGGEQAFLAAVKKGPRCLRWPREFVGGAMALMMQRRARAATSLVATYRDPGFFDSAYRNVDAPSYLPYLAALVRNCAAHPDAYYEGLSVDLALQQPVTSSDMVSLEEVWADLQRWTDETNGDFGRFHLRKLGGYSRIGVPQSQNIIRNTDYKNFPRVFGQAKIRSGRQLDDELLQVALDELRAASRSFSAALQSALKSNVFDYPIRQALRSAYSDWDGSVPKVETAVSLTKGNMLGVDLSLIIQSQAPLRIAPVWRIDAVEESGEFDLRLDGTTWYGHYDGTDHAITIADPDTAPSVWGLAGRPIGSRIVGSLTLNDEGTERPENPIEFSAKRLWIFEAAFVPSRNAIELQESALPASGKAYLLAPPENCDRLSAYLARERPRWTEMHAVGIPDGWRLICLDSCADLTDEQRLLPDDAQASHPRPNLLRFVGGRAITRVLSRMYLPYDLPSLEVGEVGVALSSSGGLEFEEESPGLDPNKVSEVRIAPRSRYKLKLPNMRSGSYEIAASINGRVLSSLKLRVAGVGSDLVDSHETFSLDRLGNPMPFRSGLAGVLPRDLVLRNGPPLPDSEVRDVPIDALGSASEGDFVPDAFEHFLDALGEAGALDYRTARELLGRLIGARGGLAAPLMLRAMRARGHLELATTEKGHTARVHAVPPTLAALPMRCGGRRVFVATGTLRLTHWKWLLAPRKDASFAWVARRGVARGSLPGSVRIAVESGAEQELAELGFRLAACQVAELIRWSADLDEVADDLSRRLFESIGPEGMEVERLDVSSAIFRVIPRRIDCELLKVPDLDIGLRSRYAISRADKYGYIRDSRWGVWIAMTAYARMLGGLERMEGVYPLPLTYDEASQTVWVPARLNFPYMLERALVLCSGDGPVCYELSVGEVDSETGLLPLAVYSAPVLYVSPFYTEMGSGKWLAFSRIPPSVATLLAAKLGAALHPVGSGKNTIKEVKQ